MSASDLIVGAARSYLGITEKPAGSNCQPFSHRLGRPCEKWCGDFVTCCYLDGGVDLTKVLTPATASCQAMLVAARAKGWLIPAVSALPGDFGLFQFDSDPAADHTEIIVGRPANGLIRCIGGNTGARGLQSNGGRVVEQDRPFAVFMAVVRVPGVHDVAPPPASVPDHRSEEDDDMANFYNVSEDATQPGDIGKGAVVKVTATTWVHLTPDAWSLEQRLARLAGRSAVPANISQADMRAIQASCIDVKALNVAAHR